MQIEQALAYARKHSLEACLIARGRELLAESYDNGFSREDAHPLYSGTKSFWGPAAIRAEEDGILTLDEPVSETIDEWKRDVQKRGITIRMLLALTAGFGFGGLGTTVPTYDRAVAMPIKNDPGATFTYGGIPLQIFGAVFARKLASRRMTPHDYLREHVLTPAGTSVASWRTLKDGTHPLPTGAFLTAHDWLAYGMYVDAHQQEFAQCFTGSGPNPRYGLGWWLGAKGAPEDLLYASGSGGQGLYVVPSMDLVVVHYGRSSSYKHDTFLRQLFAA